MGVAVRHVCGQVTLSSFGCNAHLGVSSLQLAAVYCGLFLYGQKSPPLVEVMTFVLLGSISRYSAAKRLGVAWRSITSIDIAWMVD